MAACAVYRGEWGVGTLWALTEFGIIVDVGIGEA